MKITITELRKIIMDVVAESLENNQKELNATVDELMSQPEMQSIAAFVEYAYDNDEETYGTLELQALARNLYLADVNKMKKVVDKTKLATAPAEYRDRVKRELASYGIKFVPRAAVRDQRGFTAPLHGKNRFAGMHGGSGFEHENGSNRTPSSQRTFSTDDPTALGMGAKRKR